MRQGIEHVPAKKLIGKSLTMSLVNNKTVELWQDFMSRRMEKANSVTNDLISMQVYTPTYFENFKLSNELEKWAAVEVTNFESVPADMETFTLAGGLYAVFDYKGSGNDPGIFQYIFETWLPDSDYFLDARPHFEGRL
jgi:AraC family transcriptional regulator